MKQKHTQKQSDKTHPLLLETEATLMFQQMTYIDAHTNYISVTCNPHNAKTTIGRYWPIIGASLIFNHNPTTPSNGKHAVVQIPN